MIANPIRRFEKTALQPSWLLTLALGVSSLFMRDWWSLAFTALLLFFLGIIGSGVHPRMTAGQLTGGPTESQAAADEASALPFGLQLILVGRACTQLGLLTGLALSWVAMAVLGWRWFTAIPISLVTAVLVGAFLKYHFVLAPARALDD